MSRRLDDRPFAEVERCNEAVKRTVRKLEDNYAALKKQVDAKHGWTNEMTEAAEMLYIFIQDQVEVDRERVGKITVVMEKLRQKSKRNNIISLDNKSKLTTRRSYDSGEWRSCVLYMNGTTYAN